MHKKQITYILGFVLSLSLLMTACGKKEDASVSASKTTTLSHVVNPHKGETCKYTTAKFNSIRLNYRDYSNIFFSVENSNGLDGQDPATTTLIKVSLDTKNKIFYEDAQVAVVGNDTIQQPRIFCDSNTDTWLSYNEESGNYKQIDDTSTLLVPTINALDYDTVEDFITYYFEGFPLPEEMDGVVEGGIEYYMYSQPANDNDIIGISYDTLGDKTYDLALKPLDNGKYEIYHFNVSVNYTVGTDTYKIYCQFIPTGYSNEPLAFPDDYEEIKEEPTEIPGKPLYDNEGNPLLDENGNQIVAPALLNDDGTPMLDENGEQMYDMSVAYGIGEDMPEDMQRAIEEYENEQNTEEVTDTTQEVPEQTEGMDLPNIETNQEAVAPVEEVQQVVEGQ